MKYFNLKSFWKPTSVWKAHVVWLHMRDFTCDLTVREDKEKKCLLYSTRDSSSYLSREATARVCVCVCVCVLACMHACLWMCVSVYVWVCACKFSISPWATPTHSHVSHSMSEKDPVRQSNLYPNWYDCRLAVFILVFTDLYAYCTWLHRQQSCFCLWGWCLETKHVHNS